MRGAATRGRTRATAIAVAGVLVFGIVAALWHRGGPELHAGGGGHGVPVHIGETVHVGAVAETTGAVTLRGARIAHVEGGDGLTHRVRLVRQTGLAGLGSDRGRELRGFQPVKLPGSKLDQPSGTKRPTWFDLVLTADRPGVWKLSGLDVTYDAGFLRRKTDHGQVDVCLLVTEATIGGAAWEGQQQEHPPAGVRPADWRAWLECEGIHPT